jgi:hypothetical protein
MAREAESARYREAAQLALDQLDWCIHYLRSIHKTRIAAQLDSNRAAIGRELAKPAGNANGDPHRSSARRE